MVSTAAAADTMAVNAESLQAVPTESELPEKIEERVQQPDQVKESEAGKLVQQTQNKMSAVGLQPGQTKRPVCWSLHKYFKKVQAETPDAGLALPADQAEPVLIAVQTEPPDVRAGWKKPLEEAKAAMDSAVAGVGSSSATEVQSVPDVTVRKWAGGRPKRASGTARQKYNTLTGQQRLWIVLFIEDQIGSPGNSIKQAKKAAVIRLKSSEQTVRRVWSDRAYWKDWGEKEERKASLREGTYKRRGQRVPKAAMKSQSSGCRKTSSRGYLGRTDHCRPFVLATQTWAELEQQQGHQLFRCHLLQRYSDLLDSAIQYDQEAKERLAPSTLMRKRSLQLGCRSKHLC